MSELLLGRFGDRRLEKGGTFCCLGSWNAEVAGYGFAVLGALGREKFV